MEKDARYIIKLQKYHTSLLGNFEIMVGSSSRASRTTGCWVYHFLLLSGLQGNVWETCSKGFTCLRWSSLLWGEEGSQASLIPIFHIVQMWPLSSGHAAGLFPEAISNMVFERSLLKFWRLFFSWLTFKGALFCLGYKEVDISLIAMTDCRGSKTPRANCETTNMFMKSFNP